jgi:glutamate-ammonia-ligase adenylyltransferase
MTALLLVRVEPDARPLDKAARAWPSAAMSISSRLRHCPRPYDADRGAEALALCPWADGALADLIRGTGGSSPYLAGLIRKEADWLEGAVADPEGVLATQAHHLREVAGDQLGSALRQGKRRMALIVALCDLSGAWALEQATGALSDYADLATELAMREAVGREIRRGKLPGQSEEDIESCGGMVALAMGKGGARELNYSSDIDLICLFDESRYDPSDYMEARSSLVRATRHMAATLSDLTGEGYVFRTDLRLRPDPAVTPVCLAMEAAERYYESFGRTWERAAYIKARAAAGDIAAGEAFLTALTPFVWRKHLDFAAIQDAHDMRLRIREHKGLHGPITLPGHNMKLGRGGIREIEFFTQTRQLIAGGRDPGLRMRDTVGGLAALAQRGWIPQEVALRLTDHYRAHRDVEHRIQMVNDAQTHDLPTSPEGLARLACLSGRDLAEMEADLRRRLSEVHELTEGFFAPDPATGGGDTPEVFAKSAIQERWSHYACLRSERARVLWDRLRPDILRRLAETARPEEALVAFDGFLSGLPAGVQLFSLFEANPQLIDLLIDIVGTSPDLARHLSRNAAVFDAVIGGDFWSAWPGTAELREALGKLLANEPDYERKLDLARRWAKEWHFRVGVHLLRGLKGPEEAGKAYADLAEAVLAAMWPVVQKEFALKHGAVPGRGAVVLGMGSLGAGRLHARSDLDIIVVYDPDGVEMSEGRRPLPARQYYARLTQSLVTAMTAAMSEGRLYEVDMRLRPSGNQGPVATSLSAFTKYQREEAWTWEHLALTRARVVAGPPDLAQDVEGFRREVLSQPRDRAQVLHEVAEMRRRIAEAKGPGGVWEAKLGPGRMQEIDLIAQAASLLSGKPVRQTPRALREAAWLDSAPLVRSYELNWALQIGARLVSDKALDPESLGAGGCQFLLRLTGCASLDDLHAALETASAEAASVIEAVLEERA